MLLGLAEAACGRIAFDPSSGAPHGDGRAIGDGTGSGDGGVIGDGAAGIDGTVAACGPAGTSCAGGVGMCANDGTCALDVGDQVLGGFADVVGGTTSCNPYTIPAGCPSAWTVRYYQAYLGGGGSMGAVVAPFQMALYWDTAGAPDLQNAGSISNAVLIDGTQAATTYTFQLASPPAVAVDDAIWLCIYSDPSADGKISRQGGLGTEKYKSGAPTGTFGTASNGGFVWAMTVHLTCP